MLLYASFCTLTLNLVKAADEKEQPPLAATALEMADALEVAAGARRASLISAGLSSLGLGGSSTSVASSARAKFAAAGLALLIRANLDVDKGRFYILTKESKASKPELSQEGKATLAHVEGMRSQKAYLGLMEQIDGVLKLSADQEADFTSSLTFLDRILADDLYIERFLSPSKHVLSAKSLCDD